MADTSGAVTEPGEPDQQQWIDTYRIQRVQYVEFAARLHDLVGRLLREAGIAVVQVESRAKEVDSLVEKVRRKQDQYDHPLADVTDLIGLRVITYYVEDVNDVGDIIKQEFEVDLKNSVDKAELLGADQFGYTSVHYVAKLGPSRNMLPEWAPFRHFVFEIQVRTALQHAWAAVDHKLSYKTAQDVPDDLRTSLVPTQCLVRTCRRAILRVA